MVLEGARVVLGTPLHGLGTSQHHLHLPLADQPQEHK